MDKPLNVDDVETVSLSSSASADAEWVGGYFAYGGNGAERSTLITFAIPPGKRLGRHYDTAEETQFFIGGSGELLLDDGPRPVRKGDLIVLTENTMHDLRNTGDEDLRVIGFFSKPEVEQHWSEEVWEPDGLTVTGTPNR
ncbi:MAG TPA: cupin domain-containing protein [Solirubrobacterales bacterium]|nr:cupin domain-containing protein [Solirubrobacterales bacterium]